MESKYGNKYEVACAILDKLEQGGSGGGGGKVVLADGTKLNSSTFSTVPDYYDFSNITDFGGMFGYCNNITTIPKINTSNGTNFGGMFCPCDNLTSVPSLDVSQGTNFESMFNACSNLKSVGKLNTVNGTAFHYFFYSSYNLQTVESINLSSMEISDYFFEGCGSLENITLEGLLNCNLDCGYSPLLTFDSIKSILSAASRKTNTDAKTLNFSRTLTDNNGELATLIGSCTTKGWTITGLTLE